MAKAAQPAIATDEILFELERFELVDGRLTLGGRWFGVRGRRFVRPTLTPLSGRNLSRALADLEHKPWAAQDGEPWEAAFPWERNGAGSRFELSVSPDIVIELPSPSAKPALPRRFAALPRHRSITPAWPQPQGDQAGKAPAPAPAPPAAVQPSRATAEELGARAKELGARVQELTAQREELRGQLEASRAELERARAELAGAVAGRELATAETAAAVSAGEKLASEIDALRAERDELRGAHSGLADGHLELRSSLETVTRERDQLAAELAASRRAADELRSQLERATSAVQEAARERDDAITSHGAAIVMRRATRAAPYASHHAGWWRSALAVLALVLVVFAILIVAQVI